MWRTYNPWGHVSRADRTARQEAVNHMAAYLRIKDEPEFSPLVELLKLKAEGKSTPEQDRQAVALADALNAKGFMDRDIERAL